MKSIGPHATGMGARLEPTIESMSQVAWTMSSGKYNKAVTAESFQAAVTAGQPQLKEALADLPIDPSKSWSWLTSVTGPL